MPYESYLPVILAVILGTLGAIVYSLRILVLLERRISRIDHHIELMTMSILKGEQRIMAEEQQIKSLVMGKSTRATAAKAPKRPAKKKSAKKKSSKKKKR